MKRDESLEKRWILKLTLNLEGGPSETASTFLKMASAEGYFLYEDDFDAVITVTDLLDMIDKDDMSVNVEIWEDA